MIQHLVNNSIIHRKGIVWCVILLGISLKFNDVTCSEGSIMDMWTIRGIEQRIHWWGTVIFWPYRCTMDASGCLTEYLSSKDNVACMCHRSSTFDIAWVILWRSTSMPVSVCNKLVLHHSLVSCFSCDWSWMTPTLLKLFLCPADYWNVCFKNDGSFLFTDFETSSLWTPPDAPKSRNLWTFFEISTGKNTGRPYFSYNTPIGWTNGVN